MRKDVKISTIQKPEGESHISEFVHHMSIILFAPKNLDDPTPGDIKITWPTI
jgi:hypothetical protein